jgi:hypothetical protein
MSVKSDLLKADVMKAIDAIANDPELDDDTKEELFDEIQEHLNDQSRIISDDGDDDEDDDEIEEEDDED